ncbi:MAG: gluconeogenesis factor YvcK family protein, partial [Armatimonadota bacterium]
MRARQLYSSVKWLYPGMRVKRWLVLIPVGLALAIAGVVLLANIRIVDVLGAVGRESFRLFGLDLTRPAIQIPTGIGLIVLGVFLIFVSLRQVVRSITSVVSPEAQGKLADVVFQRRYLAQGQRIVVIGGGTGLSTMLRGLKQHTSNIVAVVTVTDDGGSSGRLQREMGMLPPGDIRNCLVALADAEPMMTELFQYRFGEETGGFNGHSFGNLLIAAMTRITGDFEKAVKETSNILA